MVFPPKMWIRTSGAILLILDTYYPGVENPWCTVLYMVRHLVLFLTTLPLQIEPFRLLPTKTNPEILKSPLGHLDLLTMNLTIVQSLYGDGTFR